MRHIVYLRTGETFYNDSEPDKPYKFVVTGNRSEAHFRPTLDEEKILKGKLSDEEKLARRKHANDQVGGRFKLKPLSWHSDEQDAEKAAAAYKSPEWENVRVVQVDAVTP